MRAERCTTHHCCPCIQAQLVQVQQERDALRAAGEAAFQALDAWVHATRSQHQQVDTKLVQAWGVLGRDLGKADFIG